MPLTFHEPTCCQPEVLPALLLTVANTCFCPVKPAVNDSARFNVKLVPEPLVEELPTFTVH